MSMLTTIFIIFWAAIWIVLLLYIITMTVFPNSYNKLYDYIFSVLSSTKKNKNEEEYKEYLYYTIGELYKLEKEIGDEPRFLQLGHYEWGILKDFVENNCPRVARTFFVADPETTQWGFHVPGETTKAPTIEVEEKVAYFREIKFSFGKLLIEKVDMEYHVDVSYDPATIDYFPHTNIGGMEENPYTPANPNARRYYDKN